MSGHALIGERYAERIATRVVEGLVAGEDFEELYSDLRGKIGALVAGAAREELGEVELSTVVRAKMARVADLVESAAAADSANAAAMALVNLGQAAGIIRLGEEGERAHRDALARIAELEREVETLRGDLSAQVPMPAGAYWLDVQADESGPVPEVSIHVGTDGRNLTGGTVTRESLAIGVREALALASSAIADDLERRRRA